VVEEILPSSVAVAASRGDILDVPLFPEEEAIVARAVDKRRREFTTARACARTALSRLGLSPQPVLTGARGAPQWPPGVVGSITHCDGYRACAVARDTDLASVGIDAERNEPLPDGLVGDIALPEELDRLRELSRHSSEVAWDRLLFSMKEAVYKAWFPLAQRWLGFEDASIEIDVESNSFSVRLLIAGPLFGDVELRGFSGRWLVRDELVMAAIAQPPPASI